MLNIRVIIKSIMLLRCARRWYSALWLGGGGGTWRARSVALVCSLWVQGGWGWGGCLVGRLVDW